MAKNKRDLIESMASEIGDALSRMGFTFDWEADNRGGHLSRYIFTRKPVAMKIRISDHRSDRTEKEAARSRTKVLDVGPHGLSVKDAVAEIAAAVGRGSPAPSTFAAS